MSFDFADYFVTLQTKYEARGQRHIDEVAPAA